MPERAKTPTNAYIALHTDATPVEPWALPDRPYVWQSRSSEAGGTRLFVALRDTNADPNPETVRTVLRLVLASGAD